MDRDDIPAVVGFGFGMFVFLLVCFVIAGNPFGYSVLVSGAAILILFAFAGIVFGAVWCAEKLFGRNH